MTFPVMVVRTVRLSLESADPGLEQAAQTLRAGRFDRLFNVTLPLASPGILVGAIVAYATSLGEFGAVITFAANIPGQTQTLPLAIFALLKSSRSTIERMKDHGRLALAPHGQTLVYPWVRYQAVHRQSVEGSRRRIACGC